LFGLAGAGGAPIAAAAPEAAGGWQALIRQSPFWESQGVHANLVTLRRWVLAGEAWCEDENRHLLFDRRARFLGYVATSAEAEANQSRINETRARLAATSRIEAWAPGSAGRTGYPFALSCKQPHARIGDALVRYTGEDPGARLWGTWDGMEIGRAEAPVSLHAAIRQVFEHRRVRDGFSLPEHVLATLAGKVIIESGGAARALSPAGARGIMQLSPEALRDCELAERFRFHRIAQIDCALRLLEQNHRNLEPVFAARFANLPEEKYNALYGMLLVQAYHGGVGRVIALLADEELGRAARYFARHHDRFTAGDIALGMILHNLGRNRLGFASLYYVTDVSIASARACAQVSDLPGCASVASTMH
jgi:hypothetical protein